jgi:hypothetical protein
MWVFDGEEWTNDAGPGALNLPERSNLPEEMRPELQIVEIIPVAPQRMPFLPLHP